MTFFSFLKKNNVPHDIGLKVDIHSHLIFQVDDGSDSLELSLELLKGFSDMGYKKVVTSPHIMSDFYNNSTDNLLPKRDIIIEELMKRNIQIEFDCAAEYYLDEAFVKKIHTKEKLLTIGNDYVLFETGFMNKPVQLHEVIFNLLSNGYKPIFAHPERYIYLHDNFDKYHEIKEKGAYFQLNLNSLNGYYSKPVQKIAEKLIDNKLIDFVGSDCHNFKHFDNMKNVRNLNYYRKLGDLNLLNNTLL